MLYDSCLYNDLEMSVKDQRWGKLLWVGEMQAGGIREGEVKTKS